MSQSISREKMTSRDEIRLFDENDIGLAWKFQVNPSSCGNHEHYEEYIRLIAFDDRRRGKGVTYIFIRNSESSGVYHIARHILYGNYRWENIWKSGA